MNRQRLFLSRWYVLAVVLVMTLILAGGEVTIADGSGIFTDSGQSLGSSNSWAVALGDLDQDGDADAFVGNGNGFGQGQANKVWLNDGSGIFSDSGQSLGSSDSWAVKVGDLDGDGDLDAFVANADGQANTVWLNDGTGFFSDSGQRLGSSDSRAVELGDVDGDGDLDALVANWSGEANVIWLNDGAGIFSQGQSFDNSNSRSLALGDIDSDGDLDVLVANGNADKVWLNDGSGSFSDSGQNLGSSESRDIVLGDVNSDGALDALVTNGNLHTLWLNDGTGVFSDSGQTLNGSNSVTLALGDVDDDGDLDAFVGNYAQADSVWLNDGNGLFSDSAQSLGSSSSTDVVLADMDGDNDLDAFVANWTGEGNQVWLNENNDSNLLAIYALAFDNDPASPRNLTPHYGATVKGIVQATIGEPNKRAVILADLDQDNDTRILVVQNGQVMQISGLPNTSGELDPNLSEYQMTNGETLGGFIRWARNTYPAVQTTFSYVGHGTFFAPETDVSTLFPDVLNAPARAASADGLIFPVPIHTDTNPDFTDHGPKGVISPSGLALALEIGTNDGSAPLTVVDVTHCFGASIEEFYELSNPGGRPYGEMLAGSPNYAYFGPEMPGEALAAMQPGASSAEMATAMIGAYEAVLVEADSTNGQPDVLHPRIMVAVESSQIPPIKASIDQMSGYLLQSFEQDEQGTKEKIMAAYLASAKYDTTFCEPQDWELAPGDALSDLSDFSSQLAVQFGPSSDVGIHATNVVNQANSALVGSYVANGTPWYALPLKPTWSFPGVGLSLYTDFQGSEIDGTTYLSWHAHWYTDEVTPDNQSPYAFVQGTATWADVFERFWQDGEIHPTAACLPEYPLHPTATCDDTEIYLGETIDVDLVAQGEKIYGVQTNCTVDPSIVAVQSATFNGFFDEPVLVGINQVDSATGSWEGAISQQNPNPSLFGREPFVTLTFQALNPGTTPIICDSLFTDRNGFQLPSLVSTCTITVLDTGTISGTVTYQGRLTHAGIEVTAIGPVTATTLTDSSGNFTLSDLQAGIYLIEADTSRYLPTCQTDVQVTSGNTTTLPPTELRGGDINDDGIINIADATLLTANFNITVPPADAQPDINNDGVINVQDLSILGGNYELTGCQDW